MIDNFELLALRSRFISVHDQRVMQLASTYSFLSFATEHFGPLALAMNMQPLVQCIHARLDELGATPMQFEAALTGLAQYQQSVRSLSAASVIPSFDSLNDAIDVINKARAR